MLRMLVVQGVSESVILAVMYRVSAGVFQNSVEFPWSGYKELNRGLACDFSVGFVLSFFSAAKLCFCLSTTSSLL